MGKLKSWAIKENHRRFECYADGGGGGGGGFSHTGRAVRFTSLHHREVKNKSGRTRNCLNHLKLQEICLRAQLSKHTESKPNPDMRFCFFFFEEQVRSSFLCRPVLSLLNQDGKPLAFLWRTSLLLGCYASFGYVQEISGISPRCATTPLGIKPRG